MPHNRHTWREKPVYFDENGEQISEREWNRSVRAVYEKDRARPRRAYHHKRSYALRSSEYDALVVASCGRCEHCGLPDDGCGTKRELGVYRDYGTGLVLGLLCAQCRGRYYARGSFAGIHVPSPTET